MNQEELKERIIADLQKLQERLEENSTYNTFRDRFKSLPVHQQRLSLAGLSLLFMLIILSIPYTHFDSSRDNISQFEDKRSLIKDLLHVQKEIGETPEIAPPPAIDSLKTRIQADLQNANLLPEQIKNVSQNPPTKNNYIKEDQNDGLIEVSLGTLNVKQVVDIAAQLLNISPSVKLKDLIMQASSPDPRYYDVIFRLLVLKVPQEEPMPVDEPAGGKKKNDRDKNSKAKH